jgi:hypothetical protein
MTALPDSLPADDGPARPGQCPCGFATTDRHWFRGHQAEHLATRVGNVEGVPTEELERIRRELAATIALAWPGSQIIRISRTLIEAIDAELADRGGDPMPQPGIPMDPPGDRPPDPKPQPQPQPPPK